MNNVKYIYFDVGGVLIDWSDVFKTAANKYNLSVNDIDSVFEDNNEQITKGLMSPQEFWRTCTEKYHISNADNYDFLDSWVADYKPIFQTHNLINKIRSQFKIGLLSNIYKGMLPLLLQKKLIPNIDYQSIVFSCDVGLKKPDTEIYKLAQQKTQVDSENILLIDDREDYLLGAKRSNWQTFLFDPVNIDKSIRELETMLKLATTKA